MTAKPETLPVSETTKTKVADSEFAVIEDLFALGHTKSPTYKVYDDGTDRITIQFRTLLPKEIREIAEHTENYSSQVGKFLTEQLETLARATVHINDMPLVWDQRRTDQYMEVNGKPPTHLTMARIIFTDMLESEYLLDIMYDAYQEFITEIRDKFENIKKKLKNPESSS